ncbi:hypothetical protein [Paucibacter soli]|uniref:hypothetical protein n=1 Tax=Paucibacter soli TaxID=3133433 RepID=UPI0030973D73
MANIPWLKKNPYMSMWLSAAHRAAATLRGQAAAQLKGQAEVALQQAVTESMRRPVTPTKAGSAKRKPRTQPGPK